MDAKGFIEEALVQPAYSHTNDEGWHLIPYHSAAAAFNEVKWYSGVTEAEAFRIRDMGFEISDITPMSTRATSVASATEIESDFSPELILMLMVDPERDTQNSMLNDLNTLTFSHNVDYITPIGTTQLAGNLPRVKWGYTKDFVDVLKKNTKFSSSTTENTRARSTVSMFQDYPIFKFMKGQKIRHVEKGATSWYPLGKINRANPLYSNKDDAKFTDVVADLFKVSVQNKLGLTTAFTPFVGMLESKGATTTNDLGHYRPMPVYIKGYPYVGKDGPIDMTVQFEIKYFYTVDFKTRRVGTYNFNLLENPPATWKEKERDDRIEKIGYSMATPRQVNYPLKTWNVAATADELDFRFDNFMTYHPQPRRVEREDSEAEYMVISNSPQKRRLEDVSTTSSPAKSYRR
ncbi:hypothetical protein ACJMK2_013445 [Sinanodonta woodiana]|uniref:Capsid protein n=1 Tax=Sinanodonta woodiana TaxID=1069815 RepID=A0ABD3V0U8_SINWO